MRLPNPAHDERSWVIDRIAPDFRLLDVWALPAQGGPDDFGRFLDMMFALDLSAGSAVSRVLFSVRFFLGRVFGWDDPAERRPIPGDASVDAGTTLRARLPEGLRDSARRSGPDQAPGLTDSGFVPLYRTDREWAAEISNGTVHGVLQLGWVEIAGGRWEPRMGVYVKPRGRLGEVYLRLIEPFRHLVVYPALMRHVGRAWAAQDTAGPRS
jgi:hypothetical protein